MKKILNLVSQIGCLFLSLVLFCVICIFLILDLAPKIVTKENTKIIINEISTKELINNKEDSLLNGLYLMAKENNIDENVINAIFNSSEFKEMINNYYGEMVEAVLYDSEKPKLDSLKVTLAISKTLDKNTNELGFSISEEDKKIIIDYIKSNSEKIIELVPNYDEVVDNLGEESIDTLRTLFGGSIKIFVLIIIIIIVLFMALIRWSAYKFAIWSGISTAISGVLLRVLSSFFYDVAINTYNLNISIELQNLIKNNILTIISNLGNTTLIIGAVQIGYYFVMKKNFANPKY